MGALSVHNPSQNCYDGEMTFLGRVLAHLPVALPLGKMIVLGHVFGVLDDCLIIGMYVGQKKKTERSYYASIVFIFTSPNDCVVKTLKMWMNGMTFPSYSSVKHYFGQHPRTRENMFG